MRLPPPAPHPRSRWASACLIHVACGDTTSVASSPRKRPVPAASTCRTAGQRPPPLNRAMTRCPPLLPLLQRDVRRSRRPSAVSASSFCLGAWSCAPAVDTGFQRRVRVPTRGAQGRQAGQDGAVPQVLGVPLHHAIGSSFDFLNAQRPTRAASSSSLDAT
jgi:hypothetical protein